MIFIRLIIIMLLVHTVFNNAFAGEKEILKNILFIEKKNDVITCKLQGQKAGNCGLNNLAAIYKKSGSEIILFVQDNISFSELSEATSPMGKARLDPKRTFIFDKNNEIVSELIDGNSYFYEEDTNLLSKRPNY